MAIAEINLFMLDFIYSAESNNGLPALRLRNNQADNLLADFFGHTYWCTH